MGHYKPYKRIAERTSETPQEWLKRCAEMGKLVRTWSDRQDLVVYGGEDTASGKAVAAFYADSAEIEVNVGKVFRGANPEFVGSLLETANQLDNPEAIGILFHEACHAKHSANWDMGKLQAQDPAVARAFMLLEEARIETRGVLENPDMAKFLKLSSLNFVLEGVTEASVRGMSEVWATAQTLALTVGRIRVGIISKHDIAGVVETIEEVLGKELFDNLSKVVFDFQGISPNQMNKGIELSTKWVELLREADPEGEGDQSSEGGEAGESGEGEAGGAGELSELGEALAEMIAESQELMESLAERMREIEEQKSEAEQRRETAQNRAERKATARQVFDKNHDRVGGFTNSKITESRKPTPEERIMAVSLGQALDKAKYRERSSTEFYSNEPTGRLSVRKAIQNKALEARGVMGTNPAWRKKSRKHTDDPTLKLGIMVDVSGSMMNAMQAMGQTAWILSEAGRRIQAKTAMVYFGQSVFPTLRVGERLDSVNVYSAHDSTEEFGKAWDSLDGALGLTEIDGVRMLVIVSDGQYRPDQFDLAIRALRECKASGVTALLVTPTGTYSGRARELISTAGWGELITGIPDGEIPNAIAKAVTASMKTLARM
tara:strand:+ start:1900 stop:3714 length:1815 start_codon:yes stop_codon:yes gene_type:complete